MKIVLLLFAACFSALSQKKPVIIFEQTPCLGSCAVFKMQLYKNRKVMLHAEKFVSIGEGHFSSRLTQEEYARIIQLFYEKEFFKLNDQYTSRVTDLPSKYITFHHDGQSKTVLDYTNAPPALLELERELFLIIDQTKWKKSD